MNIAVYDSQGGKHVLSAALVRTDTVNTWDMVLTSITGNVLQTRPGESPDQRSDVRSPERRLHRDCPRPRRASSSSRSRTTPRIRRRIAVNFGTVGSFDGLTQFAGNSTAVAREQNGYEAGNLSAVSVSNDGMLIGAFTQRRQEGPGDAAIWPCSATPRVSRAPAAATTSLRPTPARPWPPRPMSTGAGTIHGSALEKSNADVATEFVTLIEAQNGFQANARTIRVANDILRELTSLIR